MPDEKHTGVFLTEDELVKVKGMVPAIYFNPYAQGQAISIAQSYVHDCALAHGLPEIPGYYGVSEDGEFLYSPTEDKTP